MLERVALFSNLSKELISELEAIGNPMWVPRNAVILNEGDRTDSLYIVLKGRAFAVRNDGAGRQLVLNRFGPYDYFGELSFFDGKSRCATVVTRERSKLMVFPRTEFFELAGRHPDIFLNTTIGLINKLRAATQQIDELAFKDVYSRLARFLSENQNRKGVITERFTQQDIADIIGTTRETICRIINELTAGGYLDREEEKIVVLKPLPYKF